MLSETSQTQNEKYHMSRRRPWKSGSMDTNLATRSSDVLLHSRVT
jgi:hypothetical protein